MVEKSAICKSKGMAGKMRRKIILPSLIFYYTTITYCTAKLLGRNKLSIGEAELVE